MKFKLYERAELCLPDFMMSEDQKPAQKHKIVLKGPPGGGRKAGSPLIWILLLLIPVIPAFYLSLTNRAEDVAALKAPAKNEAAEVLAGEAVLRRGGGANDRVLLPDRQAEPAKQPLSCDFKDWIGVRVEQSMLEALAAQGRPQRLLPPDTSYTSDYVPERVNFDLDENGIILRIWCG
jgi:hypothetical protein